MPNLLRYSIIPQQDRPLSKGNCVVLNELASLSWRWFGQPFIQLSELFPLALYLAIHITYAVIQIKVTTWANFCKTRLPYSDRFGGVPVGLQVVKNDYQKK